MSKESEVPTTEFVAPYPSTKDPATLEKWFRQVAGLIKGMQTPKKKGNLRAVLLSQVVFIEGSVVVSSGAGGDDLLPIAPRENGFITLCSSSGVSFGVNIVKGSKNVNLSSVLDGTYLVNGLYLSAVKENVI